MNRASGIRIAEATMKFLFLFLSAMFTAACDHADSHLDNSDRLFSSGPRVEISKFQLFEKSVGIHEVKGQRERDSLNDRLRNPQTPFLSSNVPGKRVKLNYEISFVDGVELTGPGALNLFKDRTYLDITFDDGRGWMASSGIYIQLDGVLGIESLNSLREKFAPNSDSLETWSTAKETLEKKLSPKN